MINISMANGPSILIRLNVSIFNIVTKFDVKLGHIYYAYINIKYLKKKKLEIIKIPVTIGQAYSFAVINSLRTKISIISKTNLHILFSLMLRIDIVIMTVIKLRYILYGYFFNECAFFLHLHQLNT